MERKVKKSEMKLAQERQGNIAAMIGLALVHRNQLQAELSRAAVQQAEKQAAAVAREAEDERTNILNSTAWWIEKKVGERAYWRTCCDRCFVAEKNKFE